MGGTGQCGFTAGEVPYSLYQTGWCSRPVSTKQGRLQDSMEFQTGWRTVGFKTVVFHAMEKKISG